MARGLLCGVLLSTTACGLVHVEPTNPEIYRVGRFEPEDRFSWSATRFSLRFTGTFISARLEQLTQPSSPEGDGQPVRFRFDLDGSHYELFAEPDQLIDFIQRNLPDGEHHLTILRESEALVGQTRLVGLDLAHEGRVLPRDRAPKHRLEFIGDSNTVGYGIEGHEPCRFSSATELISAAFPYLVSTALEADFTVVAWSGHGVVRNYANRNEPLLPAQWTPGPTAPDVVLISLGSNDFWKGDPGEALFVEGYKAFVAKIRAAYPKADVYGIIGWSSSDERRALMRRYLEQVDVKLIELPMPRVEDGHGCVQHPSVKTHRRVADEILARLRADQSW